MVSEMFNLAVGWQDEDYVIFFVFFNEKGIFLKDKMCLATAGFS
jgi:hypothetical protein